MRRPARILSVLIAAAWSLSTCASPPPPASQAVVSLAPTPSTPRPAPPRPPGIMDLFQAIWRGNVDGIKSALDGGVDPRQPLRNGAGTEIEGVTVQTPRYPVFEVLLQSSFRPGDKEAALRLLAVRGADLNVKDYRGATPLYELLWQSEVEADALDLARLLLDLGANPNVTGNGFVSRQVSGETVWLEQYPISVVVNADWLSSSDKITMIEAFHRSKADFRIKDYNGEPLVHSLLGSHGDARGAVVRALLAAGADPNAVSTDGLSVLQRIIRETSLTDYVDVIDLALKAGADPRRDGSLLTALETVPAMKRRGVAPTEVLRRLVDAGADVNSPDSNGRFPLLQSVASGDFDIARWLLEYDARADVRDRQGNTALHLLALSPLATTAGSIDLARLLVLKGADTNARGERGRTPLYDATLTNEDAMELVYQLFALRANPNLGDEDGVAPLGLAVMLGHSRTAAFLQARGAKPYSFAYPSDNTAPASKAVISADLAAIASVPLADFSAIVARTSNGVPSTALHLAVERGDPRVLAALCARKVDWNVPDLYGRSPLQLAVFSGRADIIALLLRNGADPNYADKAGQSALSRAVSISPDQAAAMLQAGAVPSTPAAARAAIESGNLVLVKALDPLIIWDQAALDLSATYGEEDIAQFIASRIGSDTEEARRSLEEAGRNHQAFEEYTAAAATPLEAPRRAGGIARKRGSFTYALESWSPWLPGPAVGALPRLPVSLYVPKGYDGSKAYGLMIFMNKAPAAEQFPSPEYAAILDRRRLIWAGFDPSLDAPEAFCLALVYNLLGYYNIDRNRIYLGGFALGGRLAGELVPRNPRFFSGGIANGGSFTSALRAVPGLPYGRSRIAMVLVSGDYDLGRLETYAGFDALSTLGYRRLLYLQEPRVGHTRLQGTSLDKAIAFLDSTRRP